MKLFFLFFTLCFAFQLSAQSQDPAALQREIAAMENLMSRTDPSHAEYQKAAAIRSDLLQQLTQSMPNDRFSPYSSADMQQYIGLLQDVTLLFDDRANNDYAIQYAALLEKRPKFASLLEEQAVMVLQLDPAKYDIWKRFQSIHPNYYN
jgi:hypothetical protein